ncbi:MAG: bactofilin family protein [Butyricimonas faecihominis]
MRKSASQDTTEMSQTIVLNDSEIEGDIILPGNLCLFGKILGNVTAKGKVEVKSGAVVTGNISCRELEIEGLVGNVETCFLIIEKMPFWKGCAGGKLLVKAVKYDIKRLRLVRK